MLSTLGKLKLDRIHSSLKMYATEGAGGKECSEVLSMLSYPLIQNVPTLSHQTYVLWDVESDVPTFITTHAAYAYYVRCPSTYNVIH